MLKGYDPVAYFEQGKAVRGKRSICVHSTPALKSQFTSDPATHISKADSNWLKLGPGTYNSEEHSFDEPWPFGPESNPQ